MIIYGSRMYGKKNVVSSHGNCEHCGKYGKMESYDGRKWGHLYFIPLIPSGGHARVLRECKACNSGSHIPIENVPKILDGMREHIDRAVIAIGADETHFEHEGQPVHAFGSIINSIEDFYCLAGEAEVTALMDNLRVAEAHREIRMAEAKLYEVSGNHASAENLYNELMAGEEDMLILLHFAYYKYNRGQFAQSCQAAERVDAMEPNSLAIQQLLIDNYTVLNEWRKAVEIYEKCYELVPELLKEKAIYKTYKKACKKAGMTPRKA